MIMRLGWLAVFLGLAGPAMAQNWHEPERGTTTRAALMDGLRPHVEWALGTPVEFVVYELRQAGDLAFASVFPQRPGGGEIDPFTTPAYFRGELHVQDMDGLGIQALYRKSGQTWVAVHWVMGAGDVWYAYGPLCAVYRPVIPEACEGL